MITVNLFDNSFRHSFSEDGFDTCTKGIKPSLIKYVRDQQVYDGITVFTDDMILSNVVDDVVSKYKIAWCLESVPIVPRVYENIISVEHKFDYIFTFHPDLLNRNTDKYKFTTTGGTWIQPSMWSVYEKTRPVSIIASHKAMSYGHRMRHDIIRITAGLDVFGRGYKPIVNKIDALKDYMYSIVILNNKIDNYFTEALIDTFATGAVPVFWGCPNIGDFFNTDGIISFDTIEDFKSLKLSTADYKSRAAAIVENIELARKYTSQDDIFARGLIQSGLQ